MRTLQMTLDEALVSELDHVVQQLGTTRSAFTREALRSALENIREREMEGKHREGYLRKPVTEGEFDDWENEQVWGD